MGSPLPPRSLLPPLTGPLSNDTVLELSLDADIALIKVEVPADSAGSLAFLGEAGSMAGATYLVAPGEDSGWLDVQDRRLQLKRSAGNADYVIHRIGYVARQS